MLRFVINVRPPLAAALLVIALTGTLSLAPASSVACSPNPSPWVQRAVQSAAEYAVTDSGLQVASAKVEARPAARRRAFRTGGAVNDPAGAKSYASGRLGAYGWGQDQFLCLARLWTKESNWLTTATNPYSGAYGIAQALPPGKYSSAGSDWLTSYRTQIDWGQGYIRGRYGSPCGAWNHSVANNWY